MNVASADQDSELRLLALAYLNQDYPAGEGGEIEAVREYVSLEGPESVQQLIGEIEQVLDGASEEDLVDLWKRRYHAQYPNFRSRTTCREWFERMLTILRESQTDAR